MKSLTLLVFFLCSIHAVFAQWTTSGNNIYNSNSGYVGIGTVNPQGPIHLIGVGVSSSTFQEFSGNLIVQSNSGGRSATTGAELEFVLPANTDGTNPWGQSRIMAVSGNANSGDATGKLMFGTRRLMNLTGTNEWYYGNDITIDGSGNVGVGTTTPNNKLNVDPGGPGGIFIGNSNGASGGYTNLSIALSSYTNGFANIQCTGATGSSWGNIVLNNSGGSVSIGTTNPQGYLFAVNGSAIFTKAVVKLNANWPDYALDKSYTPMSLDSLSNYIARNKHLPDMPSADQIQQGGQDLGEIERLQMQKIEELTLYVIAANRRMEQADSTNAAQQKTLQEASNRNDVQQQLLLKLQAEVEELKGEMKARQ